MATSPKTTIGRMACLCCGHEIPVKQGENGTINASCPWCDFPAYAKRGTQAARIIESKLTDRPKPAAPEPAKPAAKPAAPAPTPAPPAPKKTPASIFHFGNNA